ncbi:MAG: hypothetical protein KDB79_13390 [Acidobacteria bacterium]|nr:hypothetical protein [Acidobacteriota bacterium]
MRNAKRLIKGFYNLLLPVVVLLVVAFVAGGVWLVYISAIPPRAEYMVDPSKLALLSSRGAQITDETWPNRDGTSARGWLLRGSQNAPSVILLHRYGTDRSHLLNFGVKLSETTNFTILMPDLRGHGLNPAIEQTSFGGNEVEDTLSAIDYLKTLKTADGKPLIGKSFGIFGVELGAITGIAAAAKDPNIRSIALESVPRSSNDLVASIVEARFPFGSSVTSVLAKGGTYIYFINREFERSSACDLAKTLSDRDVLLLAGPGAPYFQTSTSNLSSCFPKTTKVKAFTDLAPSGFDLTNATLEQADFYDQRVIYFFKESLSGD